MNPSLSASYSPNTSSMVKSYLKKKGKSVLFHRKVPLCNGCESGGLAAKVILQPCDPLQMGGWMQETPSHWAQVFRPHQQSQNASSPSDGANGSIRLLHINGGIMWLIIKVQGKVYLFERFFLWIIQNSWIIKTEQLTVSDRVVFLPHYNTILVGVKHWESLLCIIQSIFPVDMLNPYCQLLCGQNMRDQASSSTSVNPCLVNKHLETCLPALSMWLAFVSILLTISIIFIFCSVELSFFISSVSYK